MCIRAKQKTIDASDSLIGEIVEYERKYISEKEGLVEVSFQIPCHDWMKLKRSNPWCLVEKQLLEIRNKYIRKSR